MQPTTTIDTTDKIGTDAPKTLSIDEQFAMLTEDEKKKVIAFAERLKAERCNR